MPFLVSSDTGIPGAGAAAAGNQGAFTVPDIATRDARAGSYPVGAFVMVEDASADSTVDAGVALYEWNGSTFTKVAEAESADQIRLWTDIVGRPNSSPSSIDAAVSVSHQHQDSDADIHDAVAKRHAHGRPLSDIDQAALWRHQHQDSDADIHDAVAKRHQHQDSDADIHDAVAKRHQHQDSDADIHNAVALAHDHANRADLDQIGHDDEGRITFNGFPHVLIRDAVLYLTVAPDEASKQSGDWDEVGAAGVISAIYETQTYAYSSNSRAALRLRDGTYDFTGSLNLDGLINGKLLSIYPLSGAAPNLPDPASYTGDRAHDEALLRAAYKVVFTFPANYHGLIAPIGSALPWLNGICFVSRDSGAGGGGYGLYVYGTAYARVRRCSFVGFDTGMHAAHGGKILSDYGGHYLFNRTRAVMATAHSSLQAYGAGSSSSTLHFGDTKYGAYCTGSSEMLLGGHNGGPYLTMHRLSLDGIRADGGSFARLYYYDMDQVRWAWSAYSHAALYAYHGKVRNNTSYLGYADTMSYLQGADIDVDPAAAASHRTIYARHGSWLNIGSDASDVIRNPSDGTVNSSSLSGTI